MSFFNSAKNSRERVRWMFSSSSSCKVSGLTCLEFKRKLLYCGFAWSPVYVLNDLLYLSSCTDLSMEDNTLDQGLTRQVTKATIFLFMTEKFGQIVLLVKMILILKENLCVFTRYFEWTYQVCYYFICCVKIILIWRRHV